MSRDRPIWRTTGWLSVAIGGPKPVSSSPLAVSSDSL
jgi:hypothetical protein